MFLVGVLDDVVVDVVVVPINPMAVDSPPGNIMPSKPIKSCTVRTCRVL